MIPIAALSCIAAIVVGFLNGGARIGVLLSVLTLPIISASWAFRIAGISPIDVIGILFPAMVLIHAMRVGPPLSSVPFSGIWFVYTGYGLFSAVLLITEGSMIRVLEEAIKNVSPIMGFYGMAALFYARKAFRLLIITMLAAGIFPVVVGIYQEFVGSAALQVEYTVGLARNAGFYHDIVVLRWFLFQNLAAILLYWVYFLRKRGEIWKKCMLVVYASATLLVMYNIHSKAALLTAAIWLVVWTLGQRQARTLLFVAPMVLFVAFLQGSQVGYEVERLYSKEISGVSEGATDRDKQRIFAGRMAGWEGILYEFSRRELVFQVFGDGHGRNAHNDYIYRLSAGGYLGLCLYIVLVGLIGWRVFVQYVRSKSPLNTMAVMLFLMWLVDSIGLVPSNYPTFQWFVLGLIGLALRGVDIEGTRGSPPRTRQRTPAPRNAAGRRVARADST